MTELMQANRQWAARPPEERFTSLSSMRDACKDFRDRTVTRTVANRDVRFAPVDGQPETMAAMVGAMPCLPNHWAFGQTCSLIGAPAGYLRRLPVPMAADCVNYGLHIERNVDEIGTMIVSDPDGGPSVLHAATGPNYGRVWNDDILNRVIDRFGDGEGNWTVPGEFGKAIEVDERNTTLFRSDRDMFLFLANETDRVTIPNRRDGRGGEMARGFFIRNSEVGASTLAISSFLFDYTCSNRIVWGAEQFEEVSIRHTAGAPHRWIEELAPALDAYAKATTEGIVELVKAAQTSRIGHDSDAVNDFLSKRFNSARSAKAIQMAHIEAEGRPIETVWDAVTGITEWAKISAYTADRVDIEREAGKLLAIAR